MDTNNIGYGHCDERDYMERAYKITMALNAGSSLTAKAPDNSIFEPFRRVASTSLTDCLCFPLTVHCSIPTW